MKTMNNILFGQKAMVNISMMNLLIKLLTISSNTSGEKRT